MVSRGPVLRSIIVGSVSVSAALVGGCSDVEEAIDRGGDTPCSDYLDDDTDDRRVTVTKFLKEESRNDEEPTGTSVDAAIAAIDLLCSAQQNADTPIKDADLAGILAPK